jgi:hypothetical protein
MTPRAPLRVKASARGSTVAQTRCILFVTPAVRWGRKREILGCSLLRTSPNFTHEDTGSGRGIAKFPSFLTIPCAFGMHAHPASSCHSCGALADYCAGKKASCRWWSGVEWSGVEWSGVEWSGVEWSGVEWSGVECVTLTRYPQRGLRNDSGESLCPGGTGRHSVTGHYRGHELNRLEPCGPHRA